MFSEKLRGPSLQVEPTLVFDWTLIALADLEDPKPFFMPFLVTRKAVKGFGMVNSTNATILPQHGPTMTHVLATVGLIHFLRSLRCMVTNKVHHQVISMSVYDT